MKIFVTGRCSFPYLRIVSPRLGSNSRTLLVTNRTSMLVHRGIRLPIRLDRASQSSKCMSNLEGFGSTFPARGLSTGFRR
jgi:hypothetical protein